MNILSESTSTAIATIAREDLNFFEDNHWGSGLLGLFIEKPEHYRRRAEEPESEKLYFMYVDKVQQAVLVLIRPDRESPVETVFAYGLSDSKLSADAISNANRKLKALFA